MNGLRLIYITEKRLFRKIIITYFFSNPCGRTALLLAELIVLLGIG